MTAHVIHLIHWKEAEIPGRLARLEAEGFNTSGGPAQGPALLKMLAADPPDAVVIDLTRLPSQGRDLAIALRARAGTRSIPIIFLGGEPAKVETIRLLLPDAAYGNWEDPAAPIKRALANAGGDVIVPASVFAAYAGKPLAEKLGLKPGMRLAAVHAPDDFATTLGTLPEEAHLIPEWNKEAGLTIWFVQGQKQLREDLAAITSASRRAPVWVAWPKRASKMKSDLTQALVRAACMEVGMVDYKICAVDERWSALLFTWRGV